MPTVRLQDTATPPPKAASKKVKSLRDNQAQVQPMIKEGKSLDEAKTAFGIPLLLRNRAGLAAKWEALSDRGFEDGHGKI